MMTQLILMAAFERPDLDPVALIPTMVLGGLLVLSLILSINDLDPEGRNVPGAPSVGACGLGLLGLIAYLLTVAPTRAESTFNGMLADDSLSRAATVLIAGSALLGLLLGQDELKRRARPHIGEFCALVMGASLGMVLMSSALNTMVMFLGLELFSIALYLLCIFYPENPRSQEAGLKYFLLSSGASAVLLYGLAMLYGATGSTWINEMSIQGGTAGMGLAVLGGIFVLSGLLFKLAVVPFHSWAPDVYEGAPTSVTAFMSVATKVAALVALWRVIVVASPTLSTMAGLVLLSLAFVTILLGNLMALVQTNVKRMLAYSGIANAGYLLIAPVSGEELGTPMMFFLAAYMFGNIGAFAAVSVLEAGRDGELTRQDLRGLFFSKPWMAAAFALFLVSLAGLPPAAGFLGKFFLFGRAIATGKLFLPVVAIVGSLIGAAYYLGTAISLFDHKLVGKEAHIQEDKDAVEDELSSSSLALIICAAGVLLLGISPATLLKWLSIVMVTTV